MNRRIVALFASLSILVALVAAASVAYRALDADNSGRRAARADFERLGTLLSGVRSAPDLSDPALRARLAAHYRANPGLLLVAVYEKGSGVRWRIPSYSPYLPAEENQRANPEPRYPPASSALLSASLAGDRSGRLAVDALYVTISQGTVSSAFRDALLALGAYLALLAAALTVAASLRPREQGAYAAPGPGDSLDASLGGALGPEPSALADFYAESPLASRAAGTGPVSPGAAPSYAPPDEEYEIPELDGSSGSSAIAPSPRAGLDPDPRGALALSSEDPTPAGLYSPRTGLGWESYLTERLDAELARSASFEQDLGLLLLSIEGLEPIDKVVPLAATAIREFFSFRDLVFEHGGAGFAVVLPNMDVDHALRMAEEFLKKLTFQLRDYRDPMEFLPVFMGLSSRAGRLVDAPRTIQEAASALEKAREDKDSHIVAFRPDPDKYRLFLAARGC